MCCDSIIDGANLGKHGANDNPPSLHDGFPPELPQPLPPDFDHDEAFEELTAHLWREGKWAYWWTASSKKHPPGHQHAGDALSKSSLFFPPDHRKPLPADTGPFGYRNLYFGVNPISQNRESPYGHRGTNATIDVVNAIVAEIDLKAHENDWALVWQAVQQLHLPPSDIIFSGGGLHLYWRIGQPYKLTVDILDLSPDDYHFVEADERGSKIIRKQAPDKFNRIQWLQHKWVESQPQLDQFAKSLTQLLRVVGTRNYKQNYAPYFPVVRFIKHSPDLVYTIHQLEQFIPKPTEHKKNKSSQYTPVSEQDDFDRASNFVNLLDPSCGRFEWLYVGSCLKGQFDDKGLQIWDEWSSRSTTKYKLGEPQREWKHLKAFDNGLGRIIGMLAKRDLLPPIPNARETKSANLYYWQQAESDEELEQRWTSLTESLKGEQKERAVVGGVVLTPVQEINQQLLSIFCPTGTDHIFGIPPYAYAKPDGHLAYPRTGAELTPDDLRIAFNRVKSLRVRIEGQPKRPKIAKSIVADPTDADGWTRVIAMATTASGRDAAMNALASIGIDSFAFYWPLQQLSNSISYAKGNKTAPVAISLINGDTNNSDDAKGNKTAPVAISLKNSTSNSNDAKGDKTAPVAISLINGDTNNSDDAKGNKTGSSPISLINSTATNSGDAKGNKTTPIAISLRNSTSNSNDAKGNKTGSTPIFLNSTTSNSDDAKVNKSGPIATPLINKSTTNSDDAKGDKTPSTPIPLINNTATNSHDAKGDKTAPTPISLINIGTSNSHIEKMGVTPDLSPFASQEDIEIEKLQYIVVVMLADPIPMEFSIFFGQHIRETIFKQELDAFGLLPQPLPSLIGFIPIPGIAGPMWPKAYPDFYRPDGTTYSTRLIYRAWESLLKEYRFPTWHNLIIAWSMKVPPFKLSLVQRARTDRVGNSLESVARWFNRRHDLSEFGIELPTRSQQARHVTACPWCGGFLLLWPSDGHYVAACQCDKRPITPFVARAKWLDVGLETLAESIRHEHGLGQAGQATDSLGLSIESPSQEPYVDHEKGTRKEEEAEAFAEQVTSHFEKLEVDRRDMEEKAFNMEPGVVHIWLASAGFGKSYIFQKLTSKWQQSQMQVRTFTATRDLSADWDKELTRSNTPHQIYQTLEDICSCYTPEQKKAALGAGWQLKHNNSCPYIKQLRQISNSKDLSNWIFRHANLHHPSAQKGEMIICDESVVSALLPEFQADLMEDVKRLLDVMQAGGEAEEVKALIRELFEFGLDHKQLKPYEDVPITRLIEQWKEREGQEVVDRAINALAESPYNKPRVLFVHEQSGHQQNNEATGDEQPLAADLSTLRKRWVPEFLKALAQTIKNPVHPMIHLEQSSKEQQQSKLTYRWYIRRDFCDRYLGTERMNRARFGILDASAMKEIYQAVLAPWRILFHEYHVPPSPYAQYYQIMGLNLTRKALRNPRHFNNTINKLAHIANQHGWLFETLITHQEFKERVACAFAIDEANSLHYRNQRGSNELSGSTCALTFGDPTVPTNAITRFAHALFCHDHKPFAFWRSGKLWKSKGRKWIAKDQRLTYASTFMQPSELSQSLARPRNTLAQKAQINVHVGNFDISQFVDAPVRVIKAGRLHANRKEVRKAMETYQERWRNARIAYPCQNLKFVRTHQPSAPVLAGAMT